MEYIHFLDSDDMLSLDCIEQCVESIGEADILWHDIDHLYEDNIQESSPPLTLLQHLQITQEQALSSTFDALYIWRNMQSFSWAWLGMFSLQSFQNLRFCPQIQSEDALFGMLLFAQARQIKIASFKGAIYRFRHHSISGHGEVYHIDKYPTYMKDIALAFQDGYKVKHYHFGYSCTYISLGLLAYIRTLPDSKLRDKLIEFLQVRAIYAFGAMSFESDPKNVRPLLKPLEPYMQKVGKTFKLAYYTPWLFRILRVLKQALKRILPRSK